MNKLKQSFLSGLIFSWTIMLSFLAYWAWNNLSHVEPTDTLTDTRWNEKVDRINELWNTINILQNTISSLENISPWAVISFNLSSCPTGWIEYTPARWRFIRWIDSTWTNDTIRVAGDLQDDQIKQHKHTLKQIWSINVSWTNMNIYWPWWWWADYTDNFWWTETRPKNVALLYCVKQ